MATKILDILSQAKLTLHPAKDGRSIGVEGSLEAHHDSIVGTQKGQKLSVEGRLFLVGELERDILRAELKVGTIILEGDLQVRGATIENVLFLLGRPMPEAVLAGHS